MMVRRMFGGGGGDNDDDDDKDHGTGDDTCMPKNIQLRSWGLT